MYWIGGAGDTPMCEERVRKGALSKASKVRGNRPLTPSPPSSPISLSGKTSKLVSRDPAHGVGGRGVYGPRGGGGGGDSVGGAHRSKRVQLIPRVNFSILCFGHSLDLAELGNEHISCKRGDWAAQWPLKGVLFSPTLKIRKKSVFWKSPPLPQNSFI